MLIKHYLISKTLILYPKLSLIPFFWFIILVSIIRITLERNIFQLIYTNSEKIQI